MPIRPPRLDDRSYQEIVDEARRLIPQYCPEWTHLGESDPGMTLVQLFAWMTELTLYRLNRVPDKTYVHFLNFIGEERRPARPSVATLTFALPGSGSCELPAGTCCTDRAEDSESRLNFLTREGLTVHAGVPERLLVARGGTGAMVRELSFSKVDPAGAVVELGGGSGVVPFELDPWCDGPDAATVDQWIYVAHDAFSAMGSPSEATAPTDAGLLFLRRAPGRRTSIAGLFEWEYPTAAGWRPISQVEAVHEAPSRAEGEGAALLANLPGMLPTERLVASGREVPLPAPVAGRRWWIRGRVALERWLADRAASDLTVMWSDDRGGEEHVSNDWQIQARGRVLHLQVRDLPPLGPGWSLRLEWIDRDLPVGASSDLPEYRWAYRRGSVWEEIPAARVQTSGSAVRILGPLSEMSEDGFNLRAERLESVAIHRLVPGLRPGLSWCRPSTVQLFSASEGTAPEALSVDEAPWAPFQVARSLPPTVGQRLLLGSSLFEGRAPGELTIVFDLSCPSGSKDLEQRLEGLVFQLTYRTKGGWRVVPGPDGGYGSVRLTDWLGDGGGDAASRRVCVVLDPVSQLQEIAVGTIGGVETAWVRLELVSVDIDDSSGGTGEQPPGLLIQGVEVRAEGATEGWGPVEPLREACALALEERPDNPRMTRIRSGGGGGCPRDVAVRRMRRAGPAPERAVPEARRLVAPGLTPRHPVPVQRAEPAFAGVAVRLGGPRCTHRGWRTVASAGARRRRFGAWRSGRPELHAFGGGPLRPGARAAWGATSGFVAASSTGEEGRPALRCRP